MKAPADWQATNNDGAPGTSLDVSAGVLEDGPENDEELLVQFRVWFRAAAEQRAQFRRETAENYDYVAGHQWDDEDEKILRDQMRPVVTFNRIGPFIRAICGLEINTRQEQQFIPRQIENSGGTDLMTEANKWCRDECDAEDEESAAFRDVAICGEGWTQTRLDYDENPDGMVVVDRVPPLEMYPDPAAIKANYADAQFIMRVRDVPIRVARSMFPGVDTADLDAKWAEDRPDETREPVDDTMAQYYRDDQSGEVERARSIVRMVEVEWWTYDTAYRVLDPQSGRLVRLNAAQYRVYKERCETLGMRVTSVADRTKKYHKAICGNVILRMTDGAGEGGFSYKAMTGERDENKMAWYGLVRAMKDPQMWANKWLSQSLHIVNTNAKGGILAEEDAFVDPNEAEDSWSDPSAITWLKNGALVQGKIKDKTPPAFPAEITNLMTFAISAIPDTTGVNPEMMAQVDRNQPGIVEEQRRQQGMTILASMFNAKRRYMKDQGRLMLWLIQNFIADGRLVRIGGAENAKYVRLTHQPDFAQYDVIVDDAPTSPNMKERVWAALMQMFPLLARAQIPPQVYIEALKYSPLPASLVEKMQQMLQQPPQPGPGQQGQMMLEQSKAQLHEAQTKHELVKAQVLQSESQARIENERAGAIMDLAKVGLAQADQRLDQAKFATETLLTSHSQGHDQAMAQMEHAHNVQNAQQDQQMAGAQQQLAERAQAANEQQASQGNSNA